MKAKCATFDGPKTQLDHQVANKKQTRELNWKKKNNDVINQPHFIYFSISNSIMIDEEEHFFNWKIKQMFETFFWLLFQISCLIFGQKWDNVFR